MLFARSPTGRIHCQLNHQPGESQSSASLAISTKSTIPSPLKSLDAVDSVASEPISGLNWNTPLHDPASGCRCQLFVAPFQARA
jgi:hypothetical protein